MSKYSEKAGVIFMPDCESFINIMIAGNYTLFRAALRKLLELESGMNVVGEAGNIADTIDLLNRLHPDILLLDIKTFSNTSGIEAFPQLRDIAIKTRVILLATAIQRSHVMDALRHGVRGVLPQNSAYVFLYKCIRSVMVGEYWIDHAMVAELVHALCTSPIHQITGNSRYGLTRRECHIISGVVDGCTNKDIAHKLNISEQTVKHYLTNIFRKTGAANRLELAFFAMEKQLVS
jgi:DNA-binding NarL/FixJ family response regulator